MILTNFVLNALTSRDFENVLMPFRAFDDSDFGMAVFFILSDALS